MGRRLAGASALIPVLALGACYLGPDPVQYAALAAVDGKPVAVVAVCGRASVDVEVYRDDDTDPRPGLKTWSVTVTPPAGAREAEVELLGAARPGWTLTTTQRDTVGPSGYSFDVIPLDRFVPEGRYVLDASDPGPEGSSAPAVHFSLDDLKSIAPDQVLSPADHKHSKLLQRKSFVHDRCD